LRNQVRSQICDVALARRVHKRRGAADERLKSLIERDESRCIEARAELPDVVKLALFISACSGAPKYFRAPSGAV